MDLILAAIVATIFAVIISHLLTNKISIKYLLRQARKKWQKINHAGHIENQQLKEKGLLGDFDYDVLIKATNNLHRFPLYSDLDYLLINPDVKNSKLLPYQHAVLYGISEGRALFSNVKIADVLGKEANLIPIYSSSNKANKNRGLPRSIGVFYHTNGNSFIKEIAERLVDYLTEAGFNASLETEKTRPEAKPELCVFCAPHEFFFLSGAGEWRKSNIIKTSVMFNTEQPQTIWFSRGLLYLLSSAGVIDLLYQNVELFQAVGIPSFHFDPIPTAKPTRILEEDRSHAFFRAMPDAAKSELLNDNLRRMAERSIDISFFGNHSERREKFLAKNAEFFSKRNCFIYYRKQGTPICTNGVNDILSRIPLYVAENAKICLNIHRNDDPYFEWHRIIAHGAARGAVVVTEECLPTPLYRDGVHFLTETPRHMPHLIAWLLDTPDGRARSQEVQTACLSLFGNKDLQKSKVNDVNNFISTAMKGISSKN
ncbi:hypothetical protein [Labrys neptuniae]